MSEFSIHLSHPALKPYIRFYFMMQIKESMPSSALLTATADSCLLFHFGSDKSNITYDFPNTPNKNYTFHNPSRDKFGIKIKPVKDFEWTIQVLNGLGQKVFSQKGQYYQQLDIDVTSFANGVYFVNYQCNGERKVEKVLVQH